MCDFVKINNLKTDLTNVFVHKMSWISLCDFAFTCREDSWGISEYNKYCTIFPIENIPAGSTIFITPYCIEKFMQEIHPKIRVPYIPITYCYGPVSTMAAYINDPKIITWLGQTNGDAIKFDKFTIMPLGIFSDEKVFHQKEKTLELFNKCRSTAKSDLLYMNFVVSPHGDREKIYEFFKGKPFCKTVTLSHTWRKPWEEYINDISQAKFVISPEGDMHDCYRHWEALLAGSIPIVHRSPLDKVFEDLPVVIVDNYLEITEDFLYEKYEEIHNKKYNLEKLYMGYWIKLINGKRI